MSTPYPPIDRTASCRQPDVMPELFHPSKDTNPARIDAAKAVCRGCPFRDSCLAYGITYRVSGIWGATTDDERDTLRRKRGIKAKPLRLTGLVPHGPTKDNLIQHGTSVGVESHRRRYTPMCAECSEFDAKRKAAS